MNVLGVGSRPIAWSFTTAVSQDRAARLLAWPSFDEIAEGLSRGQIAPLYWEPATAPNLKHCNRASFELMVAPDLYDAFFNSPVGYRGQYAVSEGRGEAANRRLLAAMKSKLLAAAEFADVGRLPLVAQSLQCAQAKVWIVESEVDRQLTDPASSIRFAPWEFNAPDGQGLRAPRGTKIEVKGGWLSPTGEEVINLSKRLRSSNIHKTGDSR